MEANVIPKGWTLPAYIMHNEAMRAADYKFQEERDRRYEAVAVEKEKALKIKETADLAALSLARESQVYKDQQADVMREKNLAASGVYATNEDLASVVDKMDRALKPILEFVSSQQGASKGNQMTVSRIYSTIATVAAGIVILTFLITKLG